ncbi:MAG: hypothetical protein ACKOC5_14425 [Chloroflexota bacterium]
MSDFDPTPFLPRNPAAHTRHTRDVRWQITLPLVIGAVLLLVVTGVAIVQSSEGASLWADISLIWLMIPTMLFALIGTAITGALAYLVIRLVAILPHQFYRLNNLLLRINRGVGRASDKVLEPFIRIHTFGASVDVLRHGPRDARRPARNREGYR